MTRALAEAFAKELARRKLPLSHATVVALTGPLGAGKTAFAHGFARGLGIARNLPSPTFTLVRRYSLRRRYRNLFHVDAYRLRGTSAHTLHPLGLIEELKDPSNLFLIEWADRIAAAIPRPSIWVALRHPGKKVRARDSVRALSFRVR